jgi:tripartite ATP-independent transporter DctM subunit
MTPTLLGALSVLVLLVLIILRVPVGIALISVGFGGSLLLQDMHSTIIQFQLVSWEVATNFVLVTLPLFILMGQLAKETGLGKDLYIGFNAWFGRVPGGLAVTAIASSAGFGAVTGSSVATVTAMGNMLMPEMKRYGYHPSLATGSLASAGVLAILIPPSIPLVFYGAWTETSLGDLFLSAIVPGVMLAAFFAFYVIARSYIQPELAPRGERTSLHEKLRALSYLLPALSVLGFVLGSIYAGIATPTEAAAIGVAAVFVLACIRKRMSFSVLKESIGESALLSSNIFVLFLGGVFYSRFMTQTDVTLQLVDWVASLSLSPALFIAALVLMYLVLGAILDTFGMIILTLPFVFPLVTSMGYDPVWFGIFIVMMIELSLITPPIGFNVFVMQKVAPDVPITHVYAGALPFVVMTLLVVAILVVFPQLGVLGVQ